MSLSRLSVPWQALRMTAFVDRTPFCQNVWAGTTFSNARCGKAMIGESED